MLNPLRYYSSYLSIMIVKLLHQNHLIMVCLAITFKEKEAKTAISGENCLFSQIFFWQCGNSSINPCCRLFSHRMLLIKMMLIFELGCCFCICILYSYCMFKNRFQLSSETCCLFLLECDESLTSSLPLLWWMVLFDQKFNLVVESPASLWSWIFKQSRTVSTQAWVQCVSDLNRISDWIPIDFIGLHPPILQLRTTDICWRFRWLN